MLYSWKVNKVMVIVMNNVELNKLLNDYFEAYQNTTKIMMDLVAQPLSQNKLSFEQFLILRRIAMTDQVTLNDIATQRQVTRSAISRQVKALLMQHYIFQVPDPQDRRRLYLHMTEHGQQIERSVDQAITQHFGYWVSQLGAPKIDQVLKIMATFSHQVTRLGTSDGSSNQSSTGSQD